MAKSAKGRVEKLRTTVEELRKLRRRKHESQVTRRASAHKKCGPGQPPEPHSYVDSCSSLSPHGGGMTASARQRSKQYRVPHLPKAGWPAALLPLRRAEWGRRPQRPGNQFALARRFWVPPAIHSRESPVAAGSAAIIRQAQELSRFAVPLSRGWSRPATQKTCFVVKKLWRTYLPCGSPRKTKN
jgi:hypothetical protein